MSVFLFLFAMLFSFLKGCFVLIPNFTTTTFGSPESTRSCSIPPAQHKTGGHWEHECHVKGTREIETRAYVGVVRFGKHICFVLRHVLCVGDKSKLVHLVVEKESETSVVPPRSHFGSPGTRAMKNRFSNFPNFTIPTITGFSPEPEDSDPNKMCRPHVHRG